MFPRSFLSTQNRFLFLCQNAPAKLKNFSIVVSPFSLMDNFTQSTFSRYFSPKLSEQLFKSPKKRESDQLSILTSVKLSEKLFNTSMFSSLNLKNKLSPIDTYLTSFSKRSQFPIHLFFASILLSGSLFYAEIEESTDLDQEFVTQLYSIFNPEDVCFDSISRHNHSKDLSYHSGVLSSCVLYPNNESQISKLVKLCSQYHVKIIPFGSGTSLEGHIIPNVSPTVTINFSKMSKVIEIDEISLQVSVQVGISWKELNDILEEKDLFFPVDPGPGATIGGMIGCGASGTLAYRHRPMKNHVINCTVVLADGSIIRTGSNAPKSTAGYDLTNLFVGSEGTLGIVTQARLRVVPLVKHSQIAVITVPNLSQAAETAIQIHKNGVLVNRMELMDTEMVRATNLSKSLDHVLPSCPHVFIELKASTQKQLDAIRLHLDSTISQSVKGAHIQYSSDSNQELDMWLARKLALFNSYALLDKNQRENYEMIITDVAVPLKNLERALTETISDIQHFGLVAPIVSHLGDGNFHLFVLINSQDKEESQKAQIMCSRLVKRAIALEGTCTAEHGIGMGKKQYLSPEMGPGSLSLMKRIKKLLDPENMFSPGKVVDLDN